jgi:hypothetical protein|tara:strand:+ start:411 stop:593 length:183 start_codon:yes stop_codon:yes gene_type:complete
MNKIMKTRNDLDYANSEPNEDELEKIKSELDWYRTYGSYINNQFPNVDAEASAYADGDAE